VLKLLLGPDGEELRVLVIKEAVRVTEAMVVGSAIDTYHSLPDFLRTLVSNGNPAGPFMMSAAEQQSMVELRGRVLRIWELLQSSRNFDPSVLLPILQVVHLTVLIVIVIYLFIFPFACSKYLNAIFGPRPCCIGGHCYYEF